MVRVLIPNPDGVAGSRTREAIRNYQLAGRIQADGYVSYEMLEACGGLRQAVKDQYTKLPLSIVSVTPSRFN